MDTTSSFEKENNSLKRKLKQHKERGGIFSFYPVCMKNMSLLPLTQFTNEEKQVGQLPTEFSKESEENVICVPLSLCHPCTPYPLHQKNKKASACKTVYLYNNILILNKVVLVGGCIQ